MKIIGYLNNNGQTTPVAINCDNNGHVPVMGIDKIVIVEQQSVESKLIESMFMMLKSSNTISELEVNKLSIKLVDKLLTTFDSNFEMFNKEVVEKKLLDNYNSKYRTLCINPRGTKK